MPDSDVRTYQNVRDAVWELGWHLLERRAHPVVVVLPAKDDGSKQGLDDFLVVSGKNRLEDFLSKAEPLGEWACGVVTTMPPAHKRRRLDWLTARLKSLDATYVEFLVDRQHKSLGLGKSTLRELLKQASIWTPSPPKVEREAAAQQEQRAREEANVREEAAARLAAQTEEEAKELLKDPALMYHLGEILDQLGLAGEARNCRIIYLAITSRILASPISLTVKGESSGGKSFLVLMVLRLFPEEAYLVLTSCLARPSSIPKNPFPIALLSSWNAPVWRLLTTTSGPSRAKGRSSSTR